jgi:HD-GYP domain-containing protein (c-di-GMP phosphodiesterase class II)
VSERPYRPAMSADEAVEELRRCSGTQFDPNVLSRFIGIVQRVEAERRLEQKV